MIVENVGGAGGMNGAQRVALANPDGYQVLLGTVGTQAYNQTLYKKPLYNAVDDFAPVMLIAEQPLVLVVPKDFPANSLKSFTDIRQSQRGETLVRFRRQRLRDPSWLRVAQQRDRRERPTCAVSRLGAGIAGSRRRPHQLPMRRRIHRAAADQGRNGQAAGGARAPRSAVLPQVPTAQEQGLAGFEANNWIGLFFPRNTPEPIVRQLHDAAIKAMNVPALRVRMETIGTDLVTPDRTSTDYLKHFVSSEIEKWAAPIKASGVSVD